MMLKNLTNVLLQQKTLDRVCLISVILVPSVFMLLTFNKLVPLSEGWYAVYSDMILSGKVPYRDFEFIFPPLYAYMMSFITMIFGDSLLAFRAVGALLFICTAILFYYIFKLIFPSWIAGVAAIVSMLMLQSDAIFISYDYIVFFNFFNCLAFYLVLRTIVRSHKKEKVNKDLNLFLAGTAAALAILLRQSTGVMVLLYFIVFLILVLFLKRDLGLRRRNICFFIAGVSLPVMMTAVCLASAGALAPFLEMTLFSGAKGSMTAMLFGWFFRLFTDQTAGVIAGAVLAACLIKAIRQRTDNVRDADVRSDCLLYYGFAGAVTITVAVLFCSPAVSSVISMLWVMDFVVTVVFIVTLALCMMILLKVIRNIRDREYISDIDTVYLFFFGFLIVLCWGAGTSINITPRHIALCFGFIIAVVIALLARAPDKARSKIAAVAVVALFLAIPVAGKVITPYNWFGLTTEPYPDAVYDTEIPYFKGIKLSAEEKYIYEDFVKNADMYLDDSDVLYCYSQIPIFYTLAGKMPAVRSPVPWFDVASDQTVLDDLEYLKNNNPKMIVFADHGADIMDLQEKNYRGGAESGQRRMYEWLLDCKDGPDYTLVRAYDIEGYKIYLMVLDPYHLIVP